MRALLQEVRYALRALLARPGFSALVIAVLGAGLGCVVFMLALLDGYVLRPLPFPEPERLMQAGFYGDGGLGDVFPVSDQEFLRLRRHLDGLADVAVAARATVNLSDLDRPERYNGAHVSAGLFRVLGVTPLLGRDIDAADEAPGAPRVALISYALWQHRYGGDPGVIGRQVRLDAEPATVIGVLPPGVSFPRREDVWVASTLAAAAQRDAYAYWPVLRRHDGVGAAQIQGAMDAWFAEGAALQPEVYRNGRAIAEPLSDIAMNRSTRSVIGLMLAAVFMVLAIACANAANLLLVRNLGRRQEWAIRVALGASRGRLVLHGLAQALVLSLAALGVALLLAKLGLMGRERFARESEFAPLWLHFGLDARVLALAGAAALLTALASGLGPALHAARSAPALGLRDAGARQAGARGFARVTRVLLVGEVALSLALVLCVGSLVRGIHANVSEDLGIDPDRLLTARIALSAKVYADPAAQSRFFERLAARLGEESGVVAASVGTALPGTYYNEVHQVLPAGTAFGSEDLPRLSSAAVDDRFLAAFGARLQEGRFFDSGDTADGAPVAVVDRRFAERFGDGRSVVGRQFRLDPRDPAGALVSVVGVIAPLTLDTPANIPFPSLLRPLRQAPFRIVSLGVRTRGAPLAFAPRLAAVMRELDPDTPLYWVRDYAEILRQMSHDERQVAQSFGAFGAVALLLAAAGLYGVLAFAVSQRRREIGIRRALGARPPALLRQLFAGSALQVAAGLALGLAVGLPLARRLSDSLGGVGRGDAADAALALLVLLVAAALAVLVPARRALAVEPLAALRQE